MLQGFEARLRSLFEQDQKRARREQRTTVKLYEPLVEEGYTGSYSPVCRFVRWLAGDALQFDWSEEPVVLDGPLRRWWSKRSKLRISACAIAASLSLWLIRVPLRTLSVIAAHSPASRWMNHYVMEPVACTPASGWEKGQIENQVQHIRQWRFTPKLDFEDLETLHAWLSLRSNELGSRPPPTA